MTFPENLASVRVYRLSNVTRVGLSEAHDLPSLSSWYLDHRHGMCLSENFLLILIFSYQTSVVSAAILLGLYKPHPLLILF